MIVHCKECNAGFNLEEKMLKKTGSKVRCSSCKAVFLAYPAPTPNTPEDLAKDIGIDMRGLNSDDSHNDPLRGIDADVEEGFNDITLELDKQVDEDEIEDIDFSEDNEDASKLDLSDLEDMLDIDDESSLQEVSEEGPEDITLELDIDLDTGEVEDAEITVGSIEDTSELDLSDIEDILEIKDDSDLPASSEEETYDLGLELAAADMQEGLDDSIEDTSELDLSEIEDMLEIKEDSDLPEPSEEDEDLQLELDGDIHENTDMQEGLNEVGADTSAFDLSEIEDMLEIKDDSDLPEPSEEDEDLQLELDGDIHENADIQEGLNEVDADTSEFDLSDIEDMLEIKEDSDLPESSEEDEDLQLELDGDIHENADMQEGLDESIKDASEVDLSDIEDMFEIKDDSDLPELSEEEPEDLSLKLDRQFNDDTETEDDVVSGIEDIPLEDMSFEDDLDKELVEETVGGDDSIDEPVGAVNQAVALGATKKEKKKRPERKTNRFLMVLFILVLFGGGLYGGSFVLEKQGIKLPYLTQIRNLVKINLQNVFQKAKQSPFTEALFGKPVQQDPDGSLNLYPIDNDLQERFVDNSTTGTLYVITGKVQNNYNHPRSFIRVKADIFKKGETDSIMSKTVFCGNILTNLELENLGMNAIDLRLQNREGYSQANVDIKSGKTAPFMVVFGNLPEDMEMFNIQAAGSFP